MKIFLSMLMLVATCGAYNPQDEESLALQQAEGQLNTLNHILERYIQFRERNLKENEALFKDTGRWDEAVENEVLFKQRLKKMEADFLTFQESVNQAIEANYGPSSYARSLRVQNSVSLLEWYVKHIREMLLPEGWNENNEEKNL